jgi:glycosyltransferase involved in cell wall biosynthesis
MGLGNNVVLPGFVDDLWDTMSCFDVFVLSSLHEGLPTVIIESLAMGIPAVATRVGGTGEIITEGEDGFLTRPKAPKEIAEKVLTLLQDDELRKRMSQAGQDNARRRFDIRRRVREVEEIYTQLTSSRVPSLVAG